MGEVVKWFKVVDLDHNGVVDRCENAKFLFYLGNTREYSLNYAGMVSLQDAKQLCYEAVLDAFDYK